MTPYKKVRENIETLLDLQKGLEITAINVAGRLYDHPPVELRGAMERAKDYARSVNNKIHVYFEGAVKPNGAHDERAHEEKLIHKAKVAVRYLRLVMHNYDKEQEKEKKKLKTP